MGLPLLETLSTQSCGPTPVLPYERAFAPPRDHASACAGGRQALAALQTRRTLRPRDARMHIFVTGCFNICPFEFFPFEG